VICTARIASAGIERPHRNDERSVEDAGRLAGKRSCGTSGTFTPASICPHGNSRPAKSADSNVNEQPMRKLTKSLCHRVRMSAPPPPPSPFRPPPAPPPRPPPLPRPRRGYNAAIGPQVGLWRGRALEPGCLPRSCRANGHGLGLRLARRAEKSPARSRGKNDEVACAKTVGPDPKSAWKLTRAASEPRLFTRQKRSGGRSWFGVEDFSRSRNNLNMEAGAN